MPRDPEPIAFSDTELATRAAGIPKTALDPKFTIRPSRSALRGMTTDSLPLLPIAAAPGDGGADLEIKERLGEGGMGVVELALQRSLRREVAIKRLHAGASDPLYVEALLREARHTGQLEHPSVVPVHAIGRDEDGAPVMVMKRVVGARWRELIDDGDHPSWRDVRGARVDHHVRLTIQLCRALELAHQHEILHRDVKPDNVLIGECGEVVLLDWGLAITLEEARARTDDEAIAGTMAYMAPEMVSQDIGALGPATDVYLLAASLHHALTGRPPHGGESTVQRLASIVLSRPHPYGPAVPEELASICRRAMARAPHDRYAKMEDLRHALEDYLAHRGSTELTEAAQAPLAAMDEALATGDRALARAHLDAARFALARALELWPENEPARAALVGGLTALLTRYLEARQIDLARMLLAELGARAPELAAPFTRELEVIEAAHARETEEGARLRSDLDPAVSARERKVALRSLAAFTVASASSLVVARTLGIESPPRWFFGVFSAAIVLGYAGVTLLFRRVFFTNRINQTITALLGGLIGVVAVHRVHGMIAGIDLATIVTGDLYLASVMSFVSAAVLRDRRVLVPAALLGVGAIVATLAPAAAFPAIGVGAVLGIGYLSFTKKRADDGAPDGG